MVTSIKNRFKVLKEMRWRGEQNRLLHKSTLENLIGKCYQKKISNDLSKMSFDEIVNYSMQFLRDKKQLKDNFRTKYLNLYSERDVDYFALNCEFERFFDLDLIKELDLNFVDEFKKIFYYKIRFNPSIRGMVYRSHRWMKSAPKGFFDVDFDWRKIQDNKYKLFRYDFESTFSKMEIVEDCIFLNNVLENSLNTSRNEIEMLEAILEIIQTVFHETRHLCQMPGIDSIEELKTVEFVNKILGKFRFIPKIRQFIEDVETGYTSEYDANQFAFLNLSDLVNERLEGDTGKINFPEFLNKEEEEKCLQIS